MKFTFLNSVSLGCSLTLHPHLASAAASSSLRGNVVPAAASRHYYVEEEMIGKFLIAVIDYDEGKGKGDRSVEAEDLRRPSQTFNIEMADDKIYRIRNFGEMSSSSFDKGKVYVSGRDMIKIPRGAVVSGGTIDLGGANIEGVRPENPVGRRGLEEEEAAAPRTPEQERNLAALRQRQLQSGSKKVLVVRVVAADAAHAKSEAALRDDVLGTGGDPLNLAGQYAACSYGALTFEGVGDRARTGGASAGSTDISNGVVTVVISDAVAGADSGVIQNAVTTQLRTNFGTSAHNLADHVMLCLPPTSGSWVAYAYIDYYLSVYNNEWCSSLSVQMHEIGHNLNYGHSGEGTYAYGDNSGMMGSGFPSDDGPRMCFNAAKSWQTNWYAAKSTVVEPTDVDGTQCFDEDLYGIADFGNPDADHVLVKINDAGATDYYVTFNSKRGINSGTREAGDQVTVTSAGDEGIAYSESSLVAKLSAGGTYARTIGGKNMVVTAVSVDAADGKARVRISENGDLCGPVPPSPAPTPAPSVPPTSSPTHAPSPRPTSGPTATPCPEAEVTVDVRTDLYPRETSWRLVNTCANDAIQESVAADTRYRTKNTQYSDTYCVPSAEYRFEMLDEYGDGICCRYGNGAYSVTYQGKTEASGGEFDSLDASTFGECGVPEPPLNPTPGPTNGPTDLAPTDAPTPLPTHEPTLPPTPPPTTAPTDQPTKTPTIAPTAVPSASPTHLPTKKSTSAPTPSPMFVTTDQPTKSPTVAPINVPTNAPAPLPTKEPTLPPTSPPTNAPAPPGLPPTTGPTATACPEAEVTVNIRPDDYPAETSWRLINICASDAIQESVAKDTKYKTPYVEYSDTYCVPFAQYRFEIIDAEGDGICCGYGSGTYSVTYQGKIEASGGEFNSLDASTFGACGVSESAGAYLPTDKQPN